MEASEATPTTSVAFTITRQEHLQEYDAAGNPVESWKVSFSTPSGVSSFVTVPMDDYNADTVKQLITERVHTIESVQSLGS